ncbi:MAG: ABC transporter permease [Acidobacteriota bacterium]
MRVFRAAFLRTWRKVLRRPVHLTFSLLQPMMWMLFFGFLFERFTSLPAAGVSYPTFLVPGLCAMTALFAASQSGIGWIRDDHSGFLARQLATPARPEALLAGKLAADGSRFLLQALAVFALGAAVGAGPFQYRLASLLAAVLGLLLFAAALSLISTTIALTARNQETMATFVHLVNMPLLFTSTALVPRRQMPDWLASVAPWNPLTLAVDGLRRALLEGLPPAGGGLLVLALLAAFLFVAALTALRRLARRGDPRP